MPAALALVVAEAVQIDCEVGGGRRADEEVDALAGPDTGSRGVALQERRAVFHLRVNARVGELPVRGSRPFILAADTVAVGPGCDGRLGQRDRPCASQAEEQLTTIQVCHEWFPCGAAFGLPECWGHMETSL